MFLSVICKSISKIHFEYVKSIKHITKLIENALKDDIQKKIIAVSHNMDRKFASIVHWLPSY